MYPSRLTGHNNQVTALHPARDSAPPAHSSSTTTTKLEHCHSLVLAVLGLYGLHSGDELRDLTLQLLQLGAVLVVLLLLHPQRLHQLQLRLLQVQPRPPRVVVTPCEGPTATHLVTWEGKKKKSYVSFHSCVCHFRQRRRFVSDLFCTGCVSMSSLVCDRE